MTGVTFPVAISSATILRSSLLDFAMNVTSFWLTNREIRSEWIKRASGMTHRSGFGPPAMTQMPFGFKTRLRAATEWFPMQSKIKS